jgi:hydroxymethylbilane synthase
MVSRRLGGSCQTPLGVYVRLEGEQLALDALVGSVDGALILRSSRRGPPSLGTQLAHELAEDLLQQGAGQIIAALSPDSAN